MPEKLQRVILKECFVCVCILHHSPRTSQSTCVRVRLTCLWHMID
jgi:hypothetical protein